MSCNFAQSAEPITVKIAIHSYPDGERGGREVQSTGARRGAPLLQNFSLGTHSKKCWRNYVCAMLRPTSSVRSRGGKSPLVKKKKFVLGGCQNVSPSDKYRNKLNVFYTCCLWVRRYFSAAILFDTLTAAILFSISCSHYDILRKLIKNNLFSAPITEQFIFHQHCNTSAVFYKR